jgi:predicted Zn-dependent protease
LALPEAAKTLSLGRRQVAVAASPTPLLERLASEVQQFGTVFSSREDTPVYHLAYEVNDTSKVDILASYGAILSHTHTRRRLLDVDLRVGSYELDNTHPLIDSAYYQGNAAIAWDDDAHESLHNTLWWETNQAYKKACKELIEVRAQRQIDVASDDQSSDYSEEAPLVHLEAPVALTVDRADWEQRVRSLSALFRGHEHIHQGFVRFELTTTNRSYVSMGGHRVQTGTTHARVSFGASGISDDGDELTRSDEIDAHDVSGLPNDEHLRFRVQHIIEDMEGLAKAPKAEPYVGPALVDGKAAAVLFHEVFGHRVEGHRQKGQIEGQTFIDQVGQPIMNSVFDVYDDPTVSSVNGIDLNGFYRVDSEGVRARRAQLIEKGVFVGFLMSRMPIRGMAHSNGHGRREPGYRAIARQANLIVDPSRVTSREALERALIDEVKRQRKPFGLRIGEVTGGYTTTQRGDPQAFVVEPVMVYRVYPDGRQELVRGITLEGTPLSLLSHVLAAGNDFAVFNGFCGAESGEVPASAISPSLLLRQIEVSRQPVSGQRPPLLPAPQIARSSGRKP